MWLSCSIHSLLVFAFLVLIMMGTAADKSAVLTLKENSAENIEGCYGQRKGHALCFVINETFVHLKSKDNRTLAHFRDLQDEMFLFQVLDDVFLGKKSSKFPVHLNASHSNLHDNTWKDIYLEHKHLMTNRDSFADKFHSALDRLKNTTKLVLLHHLSTELKKNVGNHPLLMRFHMLAMTLEAKYGSNDSVVPERRWSNEDGRYRERKTKFGHVRKKRTLFQEEKENSCQDLRSDPDNNDCLGMCGYGCSCWHFICGNCCQNQLCFEHDKCCRHDMYTINCRIPIVHSLSCEDGYGGYPSCLQ